MTVVVAAASKHGGSEEIAARIGADDEDVGDVFAQHRTASSVPASSTLYVSGRRLGLCGDGRGSLYRTARTFKARHRRARCGADAEGGL